MIELGEIETPASQLQEQTTTEKPKSSQNQERGPKQLFTKKSSIKNQCFILEQAAHDTTCPTNSQGRGAGFDAPVSPMDPFFHPGINKNIQGAYNLPMTDHTKFMAGTSQQGVQSRMGAKTTPFFENGEDVDDESLTEGSGMENQPKRGTLLKRQALPQIVKWTGTSSTSFENFLNLFQSHVGQQKHMSYLLIPSFQQLWLQWGKPAWVLGAARNMKLHSSLTYITIEQIKTDITWLFNALSQALGTGRGADIIISHRATQDGIAAYHMMVVRYCFGGDIETFKKK